MALRGSLRLFDLAFIYRIKMFPVVFDFLQFFQLDQLVLAARSALTL